MNNYFNIILLQSYSQQKKNFFYKDNFDLNTIFIICESLKWYLRSIIKKRVFNKI